MEGRCLGRWEPHNLRLRRGSACFHVPGRPLRGSVTLSFANTSEAGGQAGLCSQGHQLDPDLPHPHSGAVASDAQSLPFVSSECSEESCGERQPSLSVPENKGPGGPALLCPSCLVALGVQSLSSQRKASLWLPFLLLL